MQHILLPPSMPGDLDQHALNLRLRARDAALDWSRVRAVTVDLAPLLSGLDLAADADIYGAETVPEHLLAFIQDTLAGIPYDGPVGIEATLEVDAADAHVNIEPLPLPAFLEQPSPHAIREELQLLVSNDLLGPAGGPTEEVVDDHVTDRYLVGMLAPLRRPGVATPTPAAMQDPIAVASDAGDEDGQPDDGATQKAAFFPASMGFSCSVEGAAHRLLVAATWGRYERVAIEQVEEQKGKSNRRWRRVPMQGSCILDLREGPEVELQLTAEQPEIIVRAKVRRRDDCWIVSLFLVNTQIYTRRLPDRLWIFQPELRVEDADGTAAFCHHVPINHAYNPNQKDAAETLELAMRYRHEQEFAAGHGVAVIAEEVAGQHARRIVTTFIPQYEVGPTETPLAEDNSDLAGLTLDMAMLAGSDTTTCITALDQLADAYERWIARQAERSADPAEDLADYRPAVQESLAHCRQALERIRAGIDTLRHDLQAHRAFRFMNEAMWQQRIHTLFAQSMRREGQARLDEIDVPQNRSWRPFQLAFILINLPALSELGHADRRTDANAIADLLWFPTGGGKTEAYLGLTAYTLAMRRLRGEVAGRGNDGVAVLMRYTLRLLTLQQFQRAASLLCACEILRRGDERLWGTTPFRLGLWVGQRTTPNTTEQSADALSTDDDHPQNYYRGGTVGGLGTPMQLTHCPWCGTHIERRDLHVESVSAGRGRTLIYCGDPVGACPFSRRQADGEGLPVLVVDDEIYRYLPALLIATVDKFAQMPWNGAVGMLFGHVDGVCPRHGYQSPGLSAPCTSHPRRGHVPATRVVPCAPLQPPDLIIQDELHLISGPLGTMVGLYETAVDALASWSIADHQIRPKVIASTATIRRAADQMQSLFMRRARIFPPQGLDADDNFFAVQRVPSSAKPGRRYIGICASGRRLKTALIRVYCAYLAAAQSLYLKYGTIADPWMTLVGYFNAMRELAGMKRLVDDDIRSRLQLMDLHGLAKRKTPMVEELTSRKSSTDIPRVLDLLETVFDPVVDARRLAMRKAHKPVADPSPIDVLLATNMISVGVDVQRLGLMVVAGQPKTTAEYIQATSRVGRRSPGLVCTVFNWTRPRDLSHYEHFAHYHATFYQHVEALSVTPFSPRALDRGLSALLVALARLSDVRAMANEQAGTIMERMPVLAASQESVIARALAVTGNAAIAKTVRTEIEMRIQEWLAEANVDTGGRTLGYRAMRTGTTVGLLHEPAEVWQLFTCLNSLRDVEPQVNLILHESKPDRGSEPPFVAMPNSDIVEEDDL